MRPATPAEEQHWDDLVLANPDGGDIMQAKIWGNFKSEWGWQPKRYIHQLSDGRPIAAQWLVRKTPLGNIWLCPHGPGVASESELLETIEQTREANFSGILARFEPQIPVSQVSMNRLFDLGLIKSDREVTTKSTILIDVRHDEDVLWKSFKHKARYNIRGAQKAGVAIQAEPASIDNFWTMYRLIKEAESYGHFGLRPHDYYEDFWRECIKSGQGQLFFAYHEGKPVAGAFITFFGGKAWYKDGGSRRDMRHLNAPYLLQWEIMRWLHQQGVQTYDLVGVPDPGQLGTGTSREGLYEFKSKFNPIITEFTGAYDLPLSKPTYKLWPVIGERLAARIAMRRPERFLY